MSGERLLEKENPNVETSGFYGYNGSDYTLVSCAIYIIQLINKIFFLYKLCY
jgi:hypothetical protein